MYKHTNQLINETSPYLLQHAHNPVDWYAWGEEAFTKAEAENKPILLSIGYSACHWCHVMEHESFENEEIAALMNEQFVCIKVDREERPDVDQLYMKFVQLFSGSGGWPMTVFLLPDGQPFYGGTYFPPEDRYGKPGFKKLLKMTADFYHNKKGDLNKNLAQIKQVFDSSMEEKSGFELPAQDQLDQAVEQLSRYYEPEFGGIGNAPKFPAVQALSLFLRMYKKSGQEHYLDMVRFTLKNMAKGGIYDQLGSGFARYSVDEKWFVPHFEKMLYDNAQLANLYLDTYLVTKDLFFLKISNEILDFVQREMTSVEGGFYASIDADSEGEEGQFYLWTKSEVYNILDAKTADLFCRRFGITEKGNFEGNNILHNSIAIDELSKQYKMQASEIEHRLEKAKQILFAERGSRIRPETDTKIIVSWNGLMLSAFSRNYQVTRNDAYRDIIEKNIQFIRQNMYPESGLKHTYKDGQAKFSAYLDDYANLIQGLLDGYEAVFNDEYLELAISLSNHVNEYFWDSAFHGYFYTSKNQEKLIRRLKDENDQSIPSGTGIMALNQLRLYSITENSNYREKCEQIFKKHGPEYSSNPYGFASHLAALDFYWDKPREVIIVSDNSGKENPFNETVFNAYLPNKVVVLISNDGSSNSAISSSMLMGRKTINNKPTAYVCQNFACSLPVTSADSLAKILFPDSF